MYGKNLEDGKNCKSMLFGIRVDGVQSDLNLTTMVESKLERIVHSALFRKVWKQKLII